MSPEDALALFRRAPSVHIATTSADGTPVLRTVHGVVLDGAIAFHAAPAGEKMDTLGRRAVVGYDEIVAEIPSWFSDPERACPATTFYLSVQAHGTIDRVDEPVRKAAVLQALMTRFQPEGRHVPITHDSAMYRAAVNGILIAQVKLDRVDGKAKLGQNKKPEELARLIEKLRERAAPGDLRAIELIRAANPDVP